MCQIVSGVPPRGPAGSGRVAGGGEETAGVLREEVLERLLWCLRCLESDLFLYKWWNPRAKDAQETRVLAFYRAPGLRGGEEAARGLLKLNACYCVWRHSYHSDFNNIFSKYRG